MERHFDQELSQIKEELLRMSRLAAQNVANAMKALAERKPELARQIDADDTALDKLEMEIDERGIQLIALRQPKARDLRFLVMVMKIASELERIGDQAVNISQRAERLSHEPSMQTLAEISQMAELAQGMIRDSLHAFIHGTVHEAHNVVRQDDRVDELYEQIQKKLADRMINEPSTILHSLDLLSIARNLERIADHATNIAEEIVYLYEARDIRHQHPPPH